MKGKIKITFWDSSKILRRKVTLPFATTFAKAFEHLATYAQIEAHRVYPKLEILEISITEVSEWGDPEDCDDEDED